MTESNAPKGLEGVIAAETVLSYVNGTEGILEYLGIPIDQLATKSTFEEVAFLLWHKRLPKAAELKDFTAQLRAHYTLPTPVKELLQNIPPKTAPMHVLRTAVSYLASFDETPDDISPEGLREKGMRLVCQMPAIVAYFDRARKKLPLVDPDPDLNIAGNILYMINGEAPDETMARALDVCLILHADHGLNASTFTSRVICSTMSSVYGAVTGGIAALHGQLHGGANERVMYMLREIGSADNVTKYLDEAMATKKKIMGFGHRVYKTLDPRATFLKAFAKDLADSTGNHDLYELSTMVEEVMTARVGSKGIYPNVDFYSATTYKSIGIEIDMFTPMFAISRVTGWVGHILEQNEANRIMRPRAAYIGPHNAPYVPFDER
ncbi:MAG: citrate synthase [Planctomycetes bacterium]|nr:citrate synthase [Planctomycetota bacterium]NOG54470.1 citrate synthase [Planctomycetota bacterium]